MNDFFWTAFYGWGVGYYLGARRLGWAIAHIVLLIIWLTLIYIDKKQKAES